MYGVIAHLLLPPYLPTSYPHLHILSIITMLTLPNAQFSTAAANNSFHQVDTPELSRPPQSQSAADTTNPRPSRKRTAAAAFLDPVESCRPAKRRCGRNGVPVPVAATSPPPTPPADKDGDVDMDWGGGGFRFGSPDSDDVPDLVMGEECDADDDDSLAMSTFATSEAPSPGRYF